MPKIHEVVQGECLTQIAYEHGFADPDKIKGHPNNAALFDKKTRPSGNILLPGDKLFIPDPDLKEAPAPTETCTTFVAQRPKRKLVLVLQDERGEPRKKVKYTLIVPTLGVIKKETTGDDGKIEADLPLHVTQAKLIAGKNTYWLQIGHLDPLRELSAAPVVTGVQARLKNLGYAIGKIDGVHGPRTSAAIRAYQKAHDLEPTGKITDDLVERLEGEYRC
jgi:hypothetical protein